MGLLAPLAEFMFREHAYRKIQGNALFVGRQTVFLTKPNLDELLSRFGLKNMTEAPVELDKETVGAKGYDLITDRYFMKSLGVGNLRFLDVTDYENADIIQDLGNPIEERWHSKFDFIYNGGCLDNMFNPGVAIMNLSRMLRPGGRIICTESASSWNSPYLIYSPGWFYDYFVTNGYADCRVYIASYHNNDELFFGPWTLHSINMEKDRNGPAPEPDRGTHLLVLVIAEKADHSTSDKQPIQYQYRLKPEWINSFHENEKALKESLRPLLGTPSDDYLTPSGTLQGVPNQNASAGTLDQGRSVSRMRRWARKVRRGLSRT